MEMNRIVYLPPGRAIGFRTIFNFQFTSCVKKMAAKDIRFKHKL
jgi:hypothetical protein